MSMLASPANPGEGDHLRAMMTRSCASVMSLAQLVGDACQSGNLTAQAKEDLEMMGREIVRLSLLMGRYEEAGK
jgi:hypothetical protein